MYSAPALGVEDIMSLNWHKYMKPSIYHCVFREYYHRVCGIMNAMPIKAWGGK